MFATAFGLLPLVSSVRARNIRNARGSLRSARPVFESLEGRQLLSTVVDSSAHSTVFGQPLTLTAVVTDGGTGTVTFFDAGATLGAVPLDSSGQAKLFAPALPVGTHSITAAYGGDASHPASTSPAFTQVVSPAVTSTTLNASAGLVINPVLRPDHVVVVIEEDRFAQAVGDVANMPYINQVASGGLVYNNSHGVNAQAQLFGELNYLSLYSGSTQGITDDGPLYSFAGPNLAKSLADAGLSFTGYVENLPAAGDTTTIFAPDPANPAVTDAYASYYNPMAHFTDVGPGKTNADVNKPFSGFPTDYSQLPSVSFVIPDRLHNTHGSNETPPFASDPDTYNPLRQAADAWLHDHLDGYLQWAKTHNSLLIVTTEGGNREHDFAAGGTTVVAGDARLVTPGVNASPMTHYNVLRTIESMFGLSPIADEATAAVLDTDAQGRLMPSGPVAQAILSGQTVTYTASVAPLAPGSGVPVGTVQFKVDGANFGAPVALANGSASAVVGPISASHTISAEYLGSAGYSPSRSPLLTQPVTPSQATSSVALASSAASAKAGQALTFTATITGTPAGTTPPTGTVTFRDGSTVLGTAPVGANGQATWTTSGLTVGTHFITAAYSGDAKYTAATSPALTQNVVPNATSVALTSSAASANVGQSITFTAAVTTPTGGALKPTGTVTFQDGTTVLGRMAVDATGKATLSTSALTAGTHSITALYSGDSNFSGGLSAALTQTVVAAQAGPANDSFANRITLNGTSASVTGSNVGATKEAGEPSHGGNAGGKSVWYTWKAPVTTLVTIDTLGSNFKTLLGVYTGSSVSALSRVVGVPLTLGGAATFSFLAKAGQTYQIAVDGVNGAAGNFNLRLRTWTLPRTGGDDKRKKEPTSREIEKAVKDQAAKEAKDKAAKEKAAKSKSTKAAKAAK